MGSAASGVSWTVLLGLPAQAASQALRGRAPTQGWASAVAPAPCGPVVVSTRSTSQAAPTGKAVAFRFLSRENTSRSLSSVHALRALLGDSRGQGGPLPLGAQGSRRGHERLERPRGPSHGLCLSCAGFTWGGAWRPPPAASDGDRSGVVASGAPAGAGSLAQGEPSWARAAARLASLHSVRRVPEGGARAGAAATPTRKHPRGPHQAACPPGICRGRPAVGPPWTSRVLGTSDRSVRVGVGV